MKKEELTEQCDAWAKGSAQPAPRQGPAMQGFAAAMAGMTGNAAGPGKTAQAAGQIKAALNRLP